MGLIRSRKEALDEFSQAIAERFAEKPEPKTKAEPEPKRSREEGTDDELPRRKARRGKGSSGPSDTPSRPRASRSSTPVVQRRGPRARDAAADVEARPDEPFVLPEGAGASVQVRRRGERARSGGGRVPGRTGEPGAPEGPPGDGAPHHQGVPLGELLVRKGFLSEDTIVEALTTQSESGKRLGALLVELGLVDERDVMNVLAEQLAMDTVDLRKVASDPEAIAMLPEEIARELTAIPIQQVGERVEVAVGDPFEDAITARLIEAMEAPVRLVLAAPSDIRRAIDSSYKATARVDDAIRVFEARERDRRSTTEEVGPVQVVDENAPAVQVVNLLLAQAVRDRASDIHIEPMEDRLRVRNRTDGALHEVFSLPVSMAQSLVSRIKVMADMNIVERRRPQDGQIEVTVDGRELDVRVSTTSTVHGEKAVLRLLDKSRALFKLSELGMPADTYDHYKDLVRSPYGMVICAGPTGSGKTTTLYATLTEINKPEINVTTIEDPVEYVFPTVNQIQINEQAGITFAAGLRSILRQDPDSILVGEIRDVETARIAVQAALTGHLVLSSIHATDATAALHRFLDMGIESFLIASSLLGVAGQRLMRRICPHCKVPYEPTAEERAFYERSGGPEKTGFVHGEGCNFCAQTGFYDRIGIYEVLRVSPEMKQLIVENAPHEVIRALAIEQGMRTLRDQALRLVVDDETTVAEMMRVVYVL